MKTISKFTHVLLACCLMCASTALTGCVSNGSDSAMNDKSQAYRDNSTESEALSMAQNFIREEFASNAEFEDEGTIDEETSVPGRFKVLQKFTAEDHPSNWTKFVYRIWVQRFDDGTWEFGNLQIESITGEHVFTTNGRMKERERSEGVGDTLTAAGISFKIAEKQSEAIRIYTPEKLSRDQLRQVTKELMSQYSHIQFATDAKHERGDEYATWSDPYFCDMDNNEVLTKEKFFK